MGCGKKKRFWKKERKNKIERQRRLRSQSEK